MTRHASDMFHVGGELSSEGYLRGVPIYPVGRNTAFVEEFFREMRLCSL